MMPEDDLRKRLRAAASDPGPKEEWDSFIRLAHRRRAIQLASVAGGAVVMILAVAAAVFVARGTVSPPELPDPAETNDEREVEKEEQEELEKKLEDVQRRFLKDQEVAKVIEPIVRDAPPGKSGVRDAPEASEPDDEGPTRPAGDEETQPAGPEVGVSKCRGDKATIVGTNGNDRLTGTSGRDIIVAGSGDDVVRSGAGADYICGGAGNDTLAGEGQNDSILGSAGNDAIDGGAGYDWVHFPEAIGPVEVDLSAGRAQDGQANGIDTLTAIEAAVGTPYYDTFVGNGVRNWFFGDAGQDNFDGRGGDDVLYGGPGDDLLTGGPGNDTIGFLGQWIPGNPGVEVDLRQNIALGEGRDYLAYIESATGTFGKDVFSGDNNNNNFYGSFGEDTLSGGLGDDTVSGGPGQDHLDGGPGTDFLDGGGDMDTCTTGESTQDCEAGAVAAFLGAAAAATWLAQRKRKRRKLFSPR